MLPKEFGDNFVLGLDFGLQMLALPIRGGFVATLVGGILFPSEAGRSVLEQLQLPVIEVDGTYAVLVKEVREGDLFEEAFPINRDFLFRR